MPGMPIQSQREQFGAFEPGPEVRPLVASHGYDEDAAALAASRSQFGITAGLNDPRRMQRQAMPAPMGTDPDFTPRQEGGPHGDIYHGDGDWFSDYGQEPDAADRARWQDLTRQRDESLQQAIDAGENVYGPPGGDYSQADLDAMLERDQGPQDFDPTATSGLDDGYDREMFAARDDIAEDVWKRHQFGHDDDHDEDDESRESGNEHD